MGIKALSIFVMLGLVSCAQGHCRRQSDAPEAAQPLAATPIVNAKPSEQDRIFVYKYDGSLQCGMGNPIALEVMARELGNIPVISSQKKNDGLMHIQVCGSVSGKANVYEISAKFQKEAEANGFKRWTFE